MDTRPANHLSHDSPGGVRGVGGVGHLLLHADEVAEGHVLRVHLHVSLLGVDCRVLAGVADLLGPDQSLDPVGQAPVRGDYSGGLD